MAIALERQQVVTAATVICRFFFDRKIEIRAKATNATSVRLMLATRDGSARDT